MLGITRETYPHAKQRLNHHLLCSQLVPIGMDAAKLSSVLNKIKALPNISICKIAHQTKVFRNLGASVLKSMLTEI